MSDPTPTAAPFSELGLSAPILRALSDAGYEAPTPIQAATVPVLLAGRDVIGQAQTGTGKTAAFALPMLERLDLKDGHVQGLVLVPTRELAIQVAEAIHTYARHMGTVVVIPIYGGAPFANQLRHLRRAVHVVVGTPGRVMDHMRQETLDLSRVRMVVLDEADEMLRMGFAEDVDWILSQTPPARQTALFTATMPPRIRAIAEGHLRDPAPVSVAEKTLTVPAVEQRYLNVSESQKLDALTRILGAEEIEAVLVFARTKNGAAELTEKLVARGWAAEALHGDMSQAQRETLIKRFRARQVEVVVATDVAARGLDVEHITHVVNYDAPNDVESYVHRIGRTGRAGRAGVALLFVTPRQRGMMREIERYTGQRIEPMRVPTRADVAARTVDSFKQTVKRSLAEAASLDVYVRLVEDLAEEHGADMAEVAAALARMVLGEKPIEGGSDGPEEAGQVDRGVVRLYVSAGSLAGVRPSDVVGAIANEAGVPGSDIGPIDVYERFTFVELPRRHAERVLQRMTRTTLRGRPVQVKVAVPERGAEGGAASPERGAGGEPVGRAPREPSRRQPGRAEAAPAHSPGPVAAPPATRATPPDRGAVPPSASQDLPAKRGVGKALARTTVERRGGGDPAPQAGAARRGAVNAEASGDSGRRGQRHSTVPARTEASKQSDPAEAGGWSPPKRRTDSRDQQGAPPPVSPPPRDDTSAEPRRDKKPRWKKAGRPQR
ncbi:MAG: ATP-dependent RNA helicase DeaD [Myxococcales bacterium]